MLKAGVPLSKIDAFHDLLEEEAFALTSATNLRQLLLFIRHQEIDFLKKDIANKSLSIIFDGTTHVCEAMVLVLRYISDALEIQQHVCRMMLLAKSMTGEEVACQIITALSTDLGIPSNLVLAAMRDRAPVNDVAMRTVTVIYNRMMDIGCFSHTIDHVGERLKTPVLDELVCSPEALKPDLHGNRNVTTHEVVEQKSYINCTTHLVMYLILFKVTFLLVFQKSSLKFSMIQLSQESSRWNLQ